MMTASERAILRGIVIRDKKYVRCDMVLLFFQAVIRCVSFEFNTKASRPSTHRRFASIYSDGENDRRVPMASTHAQRSEVYPQSLPLEVFGNAAGRMNHMAILITRQ